MENALSTWIYVFSKYKKQISNVSMGFKSTDEFYDLYTHII
jgi:hypothetical protein